MRWPSRLRNVTVWVLLRWTDAGVSPGSIAKRPRAHARPMAKEACHMQRLSGTDALFLSMETPAWHQHVGGLVILDPSEAPEFGFEAVRANIAAKLPNVPKYMWKLKEVPLHLDRPVWVEDREFDIDRHVRRIAVPPPGGGRELGELVGQLMGYQLDRRIPLWEMWYVDGVIGGKVALIAKYHHSLMDGLTGA